MAKSQVSIEFLLAIGAILFIFTVLFIITLEKRAEVAFASRYLEAKSDCSMLSSLIDAAFTLPDANVSIRLRNNATIVASSGFIEVVKDSQTVASCTFFTNAVTNGTAATFTLAPGNVSVRNINNSVLVRNV